MSTFDDLAPDLTDPDATTARLRLTPPLLIAIILAVASMAHQIAHASGNFVR